MGLTLCRHIIHHFDGNSISNNFIEILNFFTLEEHGNI